MGIDLINDACTAIVIDFIPRWEREEHSLWLVRQEIGTLHFRACRRMCPLHPLWAVSTYQDLEDPWRLKVQSYHKYFLKRWSQMDTHGKEIHGQMKGIAGEPQTRLEDEAYRMHANSRDESLCFFALEVLNIITKFAIAHDRYFEISRGTSKHRNYNKVRSWNFLSEG